MGLDLDRELNNQSCVKYISHFRVSFSLALLICHLGLSHSLSLLLSLSLSFSSRVRLTMDPFSLGAELSDRLSNSLPVSLLCNLLSLVKSLLHHFSFAALDPMGIRILPASGP